MWWLIFGLLLTQGAFATLVLCIGDNGHFAAETTHIPSSEHGDRDVCVDAPVLAAAEAPSRPDLQSSLARDDLTPALSPNSIPLPSNANALINRLWNGDRSMGDPTLPALRTVILLT